MSLVHVASPDEIRPRHVVLIVLVALTVAGVCLITSSAGPAELPDGARAWRSDSLFRAVVELLNLHYAQPTPAGVEIKPLIFGIGTALALLAVALALALRPRGEDIVEEGDLLVAESGAEPLATVPAKKHVSPLLGAQALMLLYVGWSFASMIWTDAPEIAYYGSVELAVAVVWPFALAYGLSRSTFRFAAYALAGAGGLAAVMAVLYFRERNPTLRASYPIGNPLQLAACLLPVLFLAFAALAGQVRDFGNPRRLRRTVASALALAVTLIAAWAFLLADSRGAVVAIVIGAAALVFFGTTGRNRIVVVLVGLVLAALAVYALGVRVREFSPTGRDATLRERYYTWGYALDLINERKLLGHGQGGYTRLADELARRDVLDDPDALKNRVANAHNEWLEVWADLGSIGLVLVAGSLLLTLLAGVRALPGMPLVSRWVLLGLLAALVALVVEECANVGLRLPGLAAVFYTVVGLIWAACMPDRPPVVRAVQRNRFTRAVSVILATAVAAAVTYWSARDFRAARAEYQVAGAVEQMRWDEAVWLAEQAAAGRLTPHRRLVAQQRLSEVYLHLARVYFASGVRRIQAATQTDPPDPNRFALGQSDIETGEAYRRQGWLVLQDLVRKAPNFYNSSWVEYQFEQIRAEFARFQGDAEAARQFDQNSAVALKRELDRRPYDPTLAAMLVRVSGSMLSVEDILRVLARPLRYHAVPSLYYEIVARVLTVPEFMEKFSPVYSRLRAASSAEALEQDPLAPEMLRLAAVVWFQEGEPELSQRALESACALYDALPPRYAYAAAACFAELADRRFFNQPTEPGPAMADLAEGARRAPPSYEGRQLIIAAQHARIPMLLAAGEESAALEALRALEPAADEPALRAALSARYASLAGTVMQRDSSIYMSALHRWVDRAIELDEGNVLAWQQKADLAFRDEDDAECVRCLREARRLGAGDEFIYRFVDAALSRRPTSKPLLEYRDELAAELEAAQRPATSPASPP